MNTASYVTAVLAAATVMGACDGASSPGTPLLPVEARSQAGAMASPDAVEHWTARGGGYELTFYPGFVSRAVVEGAGGEPVELYRQEAPFRLPAGMRRASGSHQVVLRGGAHGRDVALSVMDNANSIARITVALHAGSGGGEEVLTLLDNAQTCPPYCGPSGGGAMLSVSYPEPVAPAPSPRAPRTGRADGYEGSVDPAFARRAELLTDGATRTELFREAEAPAGAPLAAAPGEHEVRSAGGPLGRDVTVRVRDPRRHVARIEVEFHDGTTGVAGEEVVIHGAPRS